MLSNGSRARCEREREAATLSSLSPFSVSRRLSSNLVQDGAQLSLAKDPAIGLPALATAHLARLRLPFAIAARSDSLKDILVLVRPDAAETDARSASQSLRENLQKTEGRRRVSLLS